MVGVTASDPPSSVPSKPAVLGLVALLGLLAGLALMALAGLAGRSDLAVLDRPLRGNGALLVPMVGAPTVLATGWSALAMGLRPGRHRVAGRERMPTPLVAALAGLVALLLGLILAHAPILDRPLVLAAALLAPVAGWAIAAQSARLGRRGLLAGGVLALALLAAPGSFLLVLPLAVGLPLVTAGPSAPIDGRAWSAGWLAAARLLLLLALAIGLSVGAVGLGASD